METTVSCFLSHHRGFHSWQHHPVHCSCLLFPYLLMSGQKWKVIKGVKALILLYPCVSNVAPANGFWYFRCPGFSFWSQVGTLHKVVFCVWVSLSGSAQAIESKSLCVVTPLTGSENKNQSNLEGKKAISSKSHLAFWMVCIDSEHVFLANN